jgi:hypothetical protein
MSKHTLVDSLHVINPLDSTVKYMVCLCSAVLGASPKPAVSELMQTPKKNRHIGCAIIVLVSFQA